MEKFRPRRVETALSSLWRKSSGKPEETGIKAVIARNTVSRWEQ
jgi:hypothetical protein